MTIDLQLFHFLNSLAGRTPLLDGVIVFFASYLAYLLIALFLIFVAFSSYSRREQLYILLVAGFAALVARFGVTELIRFFYHRPRPFVALETPHLLTDSSWSFPSGHATFFFALSTIVYLYNKKWGIAFFAATVLMTICRVISGVHYPSDILGGAIIGSATAYSLYYLTRKMSH